MKIRLNIKAPDDILEGVEESVFDSVSEDRFNLSSVEQVLIKRLRTREAWKFLSKWIVAKKHLAIEFDSENNTATVLTSDEVWVED